MAKTANDTVWPEPAATGRATRSLLGGARPQ